MIIMSLYFNMDVELLKEVLQMDAPFGRDNENLAPIIADLKLLTDRQLEILRGYIVNCVNKNLLDEIRSILEDRKRE